MVSDYCPEISFVLRSFSKISTPGLRLACLSGPADWMDPLVKIKQISDLHSSAPPQALMLHLLRNPLFPQHLDNVRSHYKLRYLAMLKAIERSVAVEYCVNNTEGGMFIWLRLPGRDTIAISKAALKEGVAVVPGDVFYRTVSNDEKALRLNLKRSIKARHYGHVRKATSPKKSIKTFIKALAMTWSLPYLRCTIRLKAT